jgi:hypothetical protein
MGKRMIDLNDLADWINEFADNFTSESDWKEDFLLNVTIYKSHAIFDLKQIISKYKIKKLIKILGEK